jgi:hypothetical protein
MSQLIRLPDAARSSDADDQNMEDTIEVVKKVVSAAAK